MQETQETQVLSLGQEGPLKEGMATRSSILAWRIPLTEEIGGLQSAGLQRVGQSLVTKQQQFDNSIASMSHFLNLFIFALRFYK